MCHTRKEKTTIHNYQKGIEAADEVMDIIFGIINYQLEQFD